MAVMRWGWARPPNRRAGACGGCTGGSGGTRSRFGVGLQDAKDEMQATLPKGTHVLLLEGDKHGWQYVKASVGDEAPLPLSTRARANTQT